ncbi:MAG: PadR family transcriptional regulator [Patescibacteria group bacterium]|jgi:DNA-binding PadR family transcriptional regulator
MLNKELLKGFSPIIILSVLSDEAKYGYQIVKDIKKKSDKSLNIAEGTLYPLLHKLEKEKMLYSFWQEAGGRKRKYYALSAKGKKALKTQKNDWQLFLKTMHQVID